MSATDRLPEYMKFYYKALMDVYDEIEEELARKGHLYRLSYAKQWVNVLICSFYLFVFQVIIRPLFKCQCFCCDP